MAITYMDKRLTAKQLAQELLVDGLAVTRGYWTENSSVDFDAMTERERQQVNEQLEKVGDRLARAAGFDRSWVG